MTLIAQARRFGISTLLGAALSLLAAQPGSAQGGFAPPAGCWQKPEPETLEEAYTVSRTRARARQAQTGQRDPASAVLLLSNGNLKVAYSAGLLLGWGDAGDRPRFAAITAVGTSALIAPFAFIGSAGDEAIADIFNCDAASLDAVAERAASLLTDSVLAAIAREHDAGRRLLVALPGSAARPETVWDFGLLAKSRDPGALTLARTILRASTGLGAAVEPSADLKPLMRIVPKNLAFRQGGTGQEFLLPVRSMPAAGAKTRYFLIHNDWLFWDESAQYIASRKIASGEGGGSAPELVPGSDAVRRIVARKGSFLFASPKTAGGLIPRGTFDLAYLRNLFHFAFRQARQNKEWRREFPGLGQPASR